MSVKAHSLHFFFENVTLKKKKIGVHLIKIMLFSRSRMDLYFEGQCGCFQSTA